MKKLEHYGIRGLALTWFQSYLSNRQQFVTINGTNSQTKPITYGVPQGSILGPLLFIIYINDLPNISKIAKFILYADDANIIVTGHTAQEIVLKLNELSQDLLKWVDCNGLALNLKKTKFMLFTKQHIDLDSIKLQIAGTKIERKTEARFLGVIIDEKINWAQHIAAIRIKMARYLGIMYKIKRHLPVKARLQIYHSFVQSHLNFCSLVWGFAAKSHIESLFRKQKQGIRAVMPGYVNYRYDDGKLPTHTKMYFLEHGILSIHGIIVKNALLFMHKVKHFPKSLPESILLTIPDNIPTATSDHTTCADWLQIYGQTIFKSSIFNKGPLLFITEQNIATTTLSHLFSLKLYKRAVKDMLLQAQSQGDDGTWPSFLLYHIPGLRRSQRINPITS